METKTPVLRTRAAMALIGAMVIVLSALISFSPYSTGFKLSVGGMALPVLVFLMHRMPVIPTAALGGAGVVLARTAVFVLRGGALGTALLVAWPELFSYCLDGLLLWGYIRLVPLQPFRFWMALPLTLIDFFSNMAELALRMGAPAFANGYPVQLALAAVIRAVVAAFAIWLLQGYSLLVMRREDAVRYRRLLLMASMLDSELFWLQKSSAIIEKTMSAAYGLYHSLSESEKATPCAAAAMQIAVDIHEVKKEYALITRGIAEAMRVATRQDGMPFSEICAILKDSLARGGKAPLLTVEIGQDFFTRSHYALMSMLHNLLSNAVEAAGQTPAAVRLVQSRAGDDVVITVADQSGGIDEAYLGQIFLPGFSSKMDGATGAVNRGLGLCIVKELTEKRFGGRVEIATNHGGTVFTLILPADALEDEP